MNPMQDRRFYFGVDDAGDDPNSPFQPAVLQQLGVQFLVRHDTPRGSLQQEIDRANRLMRQCEDAGVSLLYNTEAANWGRDVLDADGVDWANAPDGCHYFRFRPEVLAAYTASPFFAGVAFDEAEHMQINRNWVFVDGRKIDLPFFSETTGKDFQAAYDGFVAYASQVAAQLKQAGAAYVTTEHVWPVLFHGFARAGFTPAYKQMKENWSNLWAAVAMGAARQYGRELWACLDLWFGGDYPGHSPEELAANLRFAYLLGNDKAYVENLSYKGSLYDPAADRISPYGEVVRAFTKEYVPAHPRGYTHRDYEPAVAILRFDDTDCGQHDGGFWANTLLGAYNLHASPETREWLRAWHTVTHGVVPRDGLSWNFTDTYAGVPHRSFAPANAPIVYDETATAADLQTVRLAFLCGLFLSERTRTDVARLVRENGLTAVTSARFAPQALAAQYIGGTQRFADGAGCWVLTDDMASDEVYEAVRPLLGRPDEMRLRFAGKDLLLRVAADGNTFSF